MVCNFLFLLIEWENNQGRKTVKQRKNMCVDPRATRKSLISCTYHPKNTCNHHFHLWFSLGHLAYILDSFRSYNVDNSQNPWDTKPVANDFHTNTLDFPDAKLLSFLATYKWYCSLRINVTYTIRPTDVHCAAEKKYQQHQIIDKNQNQTQKKKPLTLTLTGSRRCKQFLTDSMVSLCEIFVKSSTTRHSIKLISRGKHSRFATSNKFKHLSVDIWGILSVYK